MERMTIKPIDKQFPVAYEVTLDGETRRYVPERTAKKVKVPRKDHLRIGHMECSECGAPIGYNSRYCHLCGARLEDES